MLREVQAGQRVQNVPGVFTACVPFVAWMSETKHQGYSEHRFWGYGTDSVSPLQCPFLHLWTGDLKKGATSKGCCDWQNTWKRLNILPDILSLLTDSGYPLSPVSSLLFLMWGCPWKGNWAGDNTQRFAAFAKLECLLFQTEIWKCTLICAQAKPFKGSSSFPLHIWKI